MDSIIDVDVEKSIGKSVVLETDHISESYKTEDSSSKVNSETPTSNPKRKREEDSSSESDSSCCERSVSAIETKEFLNKILSLTQEMFDDIKHINEGYKEVSAEMTTVKHKLIRINEKLDRYERLIQFHPGNPRLHEVQYENNELK